MIKIIFLDIDGVLNDDTNESWNDVGDDYYPHSKTLVSNLNEIIRQTNAKLVLSSTWRLGLDLEQISHLMKRIGIIGEFIGYTDSLSSPYAVRGNEILKWILDNENIVGPRYEFKNYLILDDDCDMLYFQRNNFIHLNGQKGLTKEYIQQSIDILNQHK
ncbi:hypothetical protein VmeM32_00038 [Vibrio phage vB_VmeM-32]|nr:hypothetical protein VmeM32_00038 [Vibrio phage vB_VmeM-32]